MTERLLVITPVRDEAAHLPHLVEAMAAQTRVPDRWLIVDDGSADETLAVATAAARRLSFCAVLPLGRDGSQDVDARLAEAAEWRAFVLGLGHAGASRFDFVGKLDGDVIPEPTWFEALLDRMRRDASLGLAGGTLYEPGRGRPNRLRVPAHHVPGAIKLYRRTVLDACGLPEPRLGWDAVDEARIRASGHRTRSFALPVAEHARRCGAGGRPLAGRARYGRAARSLGQPWWWVGLRAAKLLPRTPVGAGAFLTGYVRSAVAGEPRWKEPALGVRPARAEAGHRGTWPKPQRRPMVVLITPARNEARHIHRVAASLTAQTRPPDRWIVVEDGSDDGTWDLLLGLADAIPWMTLLRAPRGLTPDAADRLAAAAAPRAFMWALAASSADGYTHLGKLDGDVELPADYLEALLERFAADPDLGIAGGIRREGGRLLDRPGTHVPGGLKLYRAECFELIGGLRPTLGWDAIDEVLAHMHGYTSRSFPELIAVHHRPWGSADGRLRGRVRFGRSLCLAGYPAWWVAVKAPSVARLPPAGISALGFVAGYVEARLRGPIYDLPHGYRRQLRRELLDRLFPAVRSRRRSVGISRVRSLAGRRWEPHAAAPRPGGDPLVTAEPAEEVPFVWS